MGGRKSPFSITLAIGLYNSLYYRTSRDCTRRDKKLIFLLYFTHLPRSPEWVNLYQIWYTGSPRGRNQLSRIFCRLVHGYWVCRGLKFAYPHRNWRSPLTLPELRFRLWYHQSCWWLDWQLTKTGFCWQNWLTVSSTTTVCCKNID